MADQYQTINPATGQVIDTYPAMSKETIDQTLQMLKSGQHQWHLAGLDHRIQAVRSIEKQLRDHTETYAQLMTQEMGKPIAQSRAEVEKCAFLCDFYANQAPEWLASEKIDYEGLNAERVIDPLGVIYVIMPWNFPFWQVFRALIPNLLLGNAFILKHAENVIGCANMIEKIVANAVPHYHVMKSIVIDLSLSDYIIKHDDVAAVTLTGSNRAGSAVAKAAGEVCKKSVMELGGSDPYIIREDADIEYAAKTCVQTRLMNAGQVCISPKRLIVDHKIKDDFEKAVIEQIKQVKVGDPTDEANDMGPMARQDLLETLDKQVQNSVDQGAKLVLGGEKLEGDGVYYAPTLLTDVKPGMDAFDQELFGPVLTIIESEDDKHAIELANQSPFGLGSGIFSQDVDYAHRIAQHCIQAGMCFVNKCVGSHPALPFGGVKQSGYGRECSIEALRELANVKTVLIND